MSFIFLHVKVFSLVKKNIYISHIKMFSLVKKKLETFILFSELKY